MRSANPEKPKKKPMDKNTNRIALSRNYYNKLSHFFDYISPDSYYRKARKAAVSSLDLQEGQTVLNVPVGTGQIFKYFQGYLHGTGQIIGVDLSEDMLSEAFEKIASNGYSNISLEERDVAEINTAWLEDFRKNNPDTQIDAILCDLGLSGFEDWEQVIQNFLSVLKPEGRLVVMDWELPEPSLRGEFIKWIGGGEVDRPIPSYLSTQLEQFEVDHSFNRGGVFVASGIKPSGMGS